MAQLQSNGLNIEYESYGSASSETVLLVMGLGAQLIHWPLDLCHKLVARGFRVIRFDNRDIGLSSKMDGATTPNMVQMMAARFLKWRGLLAYTLDDMALDSVGVLDALGIERAHVAGASMGGMIAQLIAADHAHRVLSLTSIMSTSGRPGLPGADPRVSRALVAPYPPAGDREAMIARSMDLRRAIASPGFPIDEAEMRRVVTVALERSYYPPGVARQLAASIAAGDRRRKLANIRAPTVVLHGKEDRLIPAACGIDTARNIRAAELRLVSGMGHDLPPGVITKVVDAICAAATRSQ